MADRQPAKQDTVLFGGGWGWHIMALRELWQGDLYVHEPIEALRPGAAPGPPRPWGGTEAPYESFDDVQAEYAYVACLGTGMFIVDVTDPALPTPVTTHNTTGTAFDVAVDGSFAYVADGGSGVEIVDVTDPAAPALADIVGTSGTAIGIGMAALVFTDALFIGMEDHMIHSATASFLG